MVSFAPPLSAEKLAVIFWYMVACLASVCVMRVREPPLLGELAAAWLVGAAEVAADVAAAVVAAAVVAADAEPAALVVALALPLPPQAARRVSPAVAPKI